MKAVLGKGVHNTRVCSGWVASDHHAAIYKVFAGHAFNHLVTGRWWQAVCKKDRRNSVDTKWRFVRVAEPADVGGTSEVRANASTRVRPVERIVRRQSIYHAISGDAYENGYLEQHPQLRD